jgi:hypothetical protein
MLDMVTLGYNTYAGKTNPVDKRYNFWYFLRKSIG